MEFANEYSKNGEKKEVVKKVVEFDDMAKSEEKKVGKSMEEPKVEEMKKEG